MYWNLEKCFDRHPVYRNSDHDDEHEINLIEHHHTLQTIFNPFSTSATSKSPVPFPLYASVRESREHPLPLGSIFLDPELLFATHVYNLRGGWMKRVSSRAHKPPYIIPWHYTHTLRLIALATTVQAVQRVRRTSPRFTFLCTNLAQHKFCTKNTFSLASLLQGSRKVSSSVFSALQGQLTTQSLPPMAPSGLMQRACLSTSLATAARWRVFGTSPQAGETRGLLCGHGEQLDAVIDVRNS